MSGTEHPHSNRPLLSVVVPVYNEEETIAAFWTELCPVLEGLGEPYEAIFVDDGSADRTPELLDRIFNECRHAKVIRLSRNFGHQCAITAGLEASRGRAVVTMDSDLQDPPSLIPEMLSHWKSGEQVVVAVRTGREDTKLRRALFWGFYRAMGFLSDFPIISEAGIFSLLDRAAADELTSMQERNRFLPGMRSWVGFKHGTVTYKRGRRAAGNPKQNIRRLFAYAFNAIFGFSYKPLRLIGLAGLFISSFSFLWAAVLTISWFLGYDPFKGFSTISVGILFLGGVQLIAIGVLGEYIARIYDEVKRRPLYVAARTFDHSAEGPPPLDAARKQPDA
ncbi:MAG TPA: glycosyltransferase family 2 protein [Candidatus Brocadiia bacterium]|nr:glycosyltransferase family 2 protein [Candidatus Brocadiia bacterium]